MTETKIRKDFGGYSLTIIEPGVPHSTRPDPVTYCFSLSDEELMALSNEIAKVRKKK